MRKTFGIVHTKIMANFETICYNISLKHKPLTISEECYLVFDLDVRDIFQDFRISYIHATPLQANNIILSDLYSEKDLIPLKIFVDRISKSKGIMISRK